jgi:hypothetical protein
MRSKAGGVMAVRWRRPKVERLMAVVTAMITNAQEVTMICEAENDLARLKQKRSAMCNATPQDRAKNATR